MPPVDLDAYLAARSVTDEKLQAILDAGKQKTAELSAVSAQKQAELAANSPTTDWVSKLGLEPGGFLANRVNDAASLAAGTSRLVGQATSLPLSLLGEDATHYASAGDVEAYNRHVAGQATPEDLQRLNAPFGSSTLLQHFQTAEQGRAQARGISEAFNLDDTVNQANRQGLNQDLATGFQPNWDKVTGGDPMEVVKGLGGLIFNAGSALAHNPSAVREYVLENAPQLLMGIAGKAGQIGMAATNIGYAVDEYQQGIENYKKANNGQLPPLEMQQKMALQAASLAAAEEGGDLVGVHATKLLGFGEHAAADVAEGAAHAVDRTSFKQALKGVAEAGIEGAAGETPTEAYQQYMEAQVEGKPWTPLDSYTAGVIGGASGAVLSGGGRAVHEGAKLAAQKAVDDATKTRADAAVADAHVKAQETGDVSQLADPDAATYDPVKALEALYGHSQKEDTTDQQKQANLAKAGEIVQTLEGTRRDLRDQLATPEQKQSQVDALKAQLAKVDPKDTETQAFYQKAIQYAQEDVSTSLKPEEAKAKQAQLDALNQQLGTAKEVHDNLKQLVQPEGNQEDISKLVEQSDMPAAVGPYNYVDDPEHIRLSQAVDAANAKVQAAFKTGKTFLDNGGDWEKYRQDVLNPLRQAAQTAHDEHMAYLDSRTNAATGVTPNPAIGKVINLSMASPQSLAPEMALKLANNTANSLTDDQRTYLRKFSEARIAENQARDTDAVSSEVLHGSDKNLGIADYRSHIGSALSVGDEKTADRYMGLLMNFEQSHREKAALAASLVAKGKNAQMVRTQDGRWIVSQKHLTQKQVTENGGLSIWPAKEGSVKVVDALQAEAKALTAATGELRAAYTVTFAPKAQTQSNTTGATNVQNQPSEGTNPQSAVPAAQVRDRAETGSAGGKVDEGAAQAAPAAGATGTADQGAGVSKTDGPQDVAPETASPARTAVDSAQSTAVEGVSDAPVAQTSAHSVEEKTQSTGDGSVAGQEGSAETHKAETTNPADSAVEVSPEADASVVSGVDKSPEGTAYQARNLVRDFFQQTSSREGDKTKRPLATVKDFLSGFSLKTAVEFLGLKNESELTDEQKSLLTGFKSTAEGWFDRIRENLYERTDGPKSKASDFFYNDMMQFLLRDTASGVDVVENVKTAMGYAAYSWIAENASRSPFNDDEAINAILDRDQTTIVEDDERNALRDIGVRQNVVVNTLGQRAVQALGLKAVKGAPLDLQARLESAIGAHVFKLLMDEGLVTRTTKTGAEMSELLGKPVKNEKVEYQFVKLARNEQGDYHPDAVKIATAIKGTQNVLDKMFSVEPGLKEPQLEPIPFDQKTTKNTSQRVPEVLAKILQHENDTPFFVRQDMWALMQQLSDETMQGIAGAEHLEDKHVYNVKSLEAGNDSLKREVERFRDFVGAMKDPEAGLYFEHVVWKQQRVGIATNMINPQTSKVHRHMLYRQAWDTKVETTNQAQMENFFLRVGEGLGVKTDKQGNDVSLPKAFEKIDAPEVKAAVDVLVQMLQGQTLTDAQQETLLQGVKAGGEAMHSLDAMMALAQFQFALSNGKTSFNTQLMGEVDGVTNGPMLTHLLLGAADNVDQLYGLLNRGGFYQVGNDHTQYNQWRGTAGNLDLYEQTIRHVLDAVQELSKVEDKKQGINPGVLPSVYAFTGMLENKDTRAIEKAGRNIIKTPLTAMVFGSSVPKAIKSMAAGFVESIYDAIEQVHASTHKALNEQELLRHLNTLLIMGKGESLPRNVTVADLMTREFKADQVKALMNAFSWTLGKAVTKTMKEDFGTFLGRRQQFNDAAQLAFEVHNAAYQALREAKISELIASGEMAYRVAKGTKVPIHDLTAQQEGEIRKQLAALAPVIHTPLSKESGSLAAGLNMSKSDRKLSQDPQYQQEVQFGTGFPDTGAVRTKTNGWETASTSPGVAMAVMSTHSADSAISHHALDESKYQALNVHDAHGTGLATFEETARNLNRSTWNVMLGYSSANEVFEALARTVRGFADLAQKGVLPPAAVKNLAQAIEKAAAKAETTPHQYLSAMVAGAKTMAFRADDMKLQAMEQLQAVDQYALQGGNYTVSEAERAQAAAQRQALSPELSERDAAATKELASLLEQAFTGEKQVVEHDIEEDPHHGASPFGELGKSSIESDKALVDFFRANPQATAERVITGLYRTFKKDAGQGNNAFNLALLQRLQGLIGKGVTVKLVTPQTAASEVLAMPSGPSRAWFVAKDGKQEIYVLDPQFVASGLTPETLLHEMTHAALSQTIANPSAEAKVLLQDLEALRMKALAFADEQKLSDQFKSALGDMQEFVTWGMTNQAFQQQVLQQISMQSKTKKTDLVTGMKAFIKSLVDLIFGGKGISSQAITVNGMTIMIGNVSGLIAAAEKTNAASQDPLNLSMAAATHSNTYSTLDIFEALDNQKGDITSTFAGSLRELLGGVVNALYGPFGTFKAQLMKDTPSTPVDVWQQALGSGVTPFASKAIASGLKITDQELFAIEQVESTMRAAIDGNTAQTRLAYSELASLYKEVSQRLKPADFEKITGNAQDAQALHDFLFKLEAGHGDRSDYLARFAALGLAHQGINSLLQVASRIETKQAATSFAERVQGIFEKILDFFRERVTHTYAGQREDTKLEALVQQLVGIEAKQRWKLENTETRSQVLTDVENYGGKIMQSVREATQKVLDSKKVRDSKNGYVRGAAAVASAIVTEQVNASIDTIKNIRDANYKEQYDVMMGVLNEIRGPRDFMEKILRNRKVQEGKRKDIIDGTAKVALSTFDKGGRDLTDAAKTAISKVFLRTGAHTLLDHMNMARLETLLGDKTELANEIAKFEAQLPDGTKKAMLLQTKALAYFKATGFVTSPALMFNAYNIARMQGLNAQVNEQQAQKVEPIINALVALHAIDYTDAKHVTEAKAVLEKENQRSGDNAGNGVEFILLRHKSLEDEALARNFSGSKVLMQHGYTPEICNPNTELVTAGRAEGRDLVAQGYVEHAQVGLDPHDPDRDVRHMYVMRDGGMGKWVSGMISMTGLGTKGTAKHSGYLNTQTNQGANNASLNVTVHNQHLRAMQAMLQKGTFDPRKVTERYMAPVINESGDIVNWRYMMNESVKDTLLERDNRFEVMLGKLAGTVFDKATATELNRQAIEAVKQEYDAEYKDNAKSYTYVGARSTDPELKQIWKMLPDKTKAVVMEVWGREGMMVRKDALDMLFGYRKLSLADAFDRDPAIRGHVEGFFVDAMEHIFGAKAALRVRQGERIWQEVIKEAKDNMVVKTGTVLLGNIWSNLSLLWLRGVPIKPMLDNHLVALKGATAYLKDSSDLERYNQLLATGYTQGRDAEIQREVVRLKDAIARNPVTKLVEAGLMPTIMDDVDQGPELYSFKGLLMKRTEKYRDMAAEFAGPSMVELYKSIYMTHDSKAYQVLARATQLSDFVARYALYQHLVTRTENRMSEEEALHDASESFVNYDVPSHRMIQYMNDMGLLMFTKYFLRIQRVLAKASKESPLRYYSMLLLNHYMALGDTVQKSLWLMHLGRNPFYAGALNYPGTLGDLATVNSAMRLVK